MQRPLVVAQHQAVLGLRRLQRVLDDDVAQVDALQQRARVRRVIGLGLAENPHRRVVVNAEGFLGRQLAWRRPAHLRRLAPADLRRGVADVERAEARVFVELGDQLEAERAVEQ